MDLTFFNLDFGKSCGSRPTLNGLRPQSCIQPLISMDFLQNVVPVDVTIIINIADTNDPPLFLNLPAVVRLKEVSSDFHMD